LRRRCKEYCEERKPLDCKERSGVRKERKVYITRRGRKERYTLQEEEGKKVKVCVRKEKRFSTLFIDSFLSTISPTERCRKFFAFST